MFFTTLNEFKTFLILIISKMFSRFKTPMLLNEISMLKNELKLKNKLIENLNLQLNPYLEKEKKDKEAMEIMKEYYCNRKMYYEK